MGAVTYISQTQEEQESMIESAVERAISNYAELRDRMEVKSVRDWASELDISSRTIIKRIEQGKIKPSFKNPYRISRFEINRYVNSH